MFFVDNHQQFFKPLTSKYREVFVECLKQLYQSLYGSQADYGNALGRTQLLDVFQEAIVRAPVLDEDAFDAETGRFRGKREQAVWMVKQLIEYGWLERQMDEATLQSHYAFTLHGREFTQPFVESGKERIRTRNRHTRNTRNALKAFLEHGDIHDLMDAFDHSERIITDFTEVIAELDQRKRDLVQAVENEVLVDKASDAFFEFMEKRFQPDLAVRLSADSVEKYRDDIASTITSIKRKSKDFKAKAEGDLRKNLPSDLIPSGHSYLYYLLDGISNRLKNACEIMLPALRKALQSFTQRADIILRQMSFLASRDDTNNTTALCQRLASLTPALQTPLYEQIGALISGVNVGFVDPSSIKLSERRDRTVIQTHIMDDVEMDMDSRRSIFVQQTLEKAFMVNDSAIRDYVIDALGSKGVISTKDLDPQTADELINAAHAIEAASASNSSEFGFKITQTGGVISNNFIAEADEFELELVQR